MHHLTDLSGTMEMIVISNTIVVQQYLFCQQLGSEDALSSVDDVNEHLSMKAHSLEQVILILTTKCRVYGPRLYFN